MKKMSAKTKVVLLLLAWLAVSGLMLGYGFKILDGQNQQVLASMGQDRQNLAVLEAEDQSFRQAKSDLQKLSSEPIQPAQFFSQDITLVHELEVVEALQGKYGVQMTLSGVAGTVDSLAPAPTASPIVMVPYSIGLTGSLAQVTEFIQALENVGFVTDINGLSISAGGPNSVIANLQASFYLLKQP